MPQISDIRIINMHELVAPQTLLDDLPADDAMETHIMQSRQAVERVIHGGDDRLLVVAGPCSIHDPKAALEYGEKLAAVAKEFSQRLLVVMRVYFEKPRTTIGWKGLINDPHLDGSCDINTGLRMARELLLNLNRMQLPCATEFLDVISPQYYADLISWGAIGARTTESQSHRELASGLSCPVGFKNGTDGNIKIAADAVRAASRSHHFLSVARTGHSAISETKGNKSCHIILRGGNHGANYDAENINNASTILSGSALPARIMVDCSHANSNKDYRRQPMVIEDIATQISGGDMRIIGAMIESNLVEGNQEIVQGQELTYGQSVTDSCINWETTTETLKVLADAVGKRQRNLRVQE
ncbi:MAG: 3-deoxy-7-phosphoheptulonate synthase [Gammaproteobacteria bacterium WSBS_2016_MAG_OTU1]